MTKMSGKFLISGQHQDNTEISGISGQLGPLCYAGAVLAVVMCCLLYTSDAADE